MASVGVILRAFLFFYLMFSGYIRHWIRLANKGWAFFSGKANKTVLPRTGLHIQENPELSNLPHVGTQKAKFEKLGVKSKCLTDSWKSIVLSYR